MTFALPNSLQPHILHAVFTIRVSYQLPLFPGRAHELYAMKGRPYPKKKQVGFLEWKVLKFELPALRAHVNALSGPPFISHGGHLSSSVFARGFVPVSCSLHPHLHHFIIHMLRRLRTSRRLDLAVSRWVYNPSLLES